MSHKTMRTIQNFRANAQGNVPFFHKTEIVTHCYARFQWWLVTHTITIMSTTSTGESEKFTALRT